MDPSSIKRPAGNQVNHLATPPAATNSIDGRFYLPFTRGRQQTDFFLDVDFSIPGSGVTGIFGPSGSGKTTLLRCIAGLQPCAQSHLRVNGETWQSANPGAATLPVHKRPIGYVFQQPSLFPHLSVEGNLTFARKRATQPVNAENYDEIVQLMDLSGLLDARPESLSGGEQQRVAIARALLVKPQLLLMDEPLAALDLARKRDILPYLEKLHQSLDIPILYVSHSVDEIARLADHLLLMGDGRIRESGAAPALLSRTDFPVQLGDDLGVLLEADVIERDTQWNLLRARFDGGDLWLRDSGEAPGERIRIRVLARDVSLTRTEDTDSSILNRLPMRVVDITADRDPAMVLVRMSPRATSVSDNSGIITARVTCRSQDALALAAGEEVWAQIKSVAIVR
ncbi:molybdenum ABC transporter ATP-binding protein [Microbulbifer agarilyticus]|uniref:molybdenum ABC transporter ATP-binding protein n=1 Tax=Microbulbifer agarilyticus TaxID=260552 RepID=UPI001C98932C|nr:molybdenum ABC transporter ATP-binding protein [Microbulbifer agarilyticus]MBY6189318.1 molybdenum ABC transporter ATP-binding protein [Microbulbifer agarilyticus]